MNRICNMFFLAVGFFALIACGTRCQSQSSSEKRKFPSELTFEKFRVHKETHIAKPEKLTFVDGSILRRDIIEKELSLGVNFSGHFRIVEWGTGAGAADFAVIDYLTGKVYKGMPFGQCGISFSIDSRMITIDFPELDRDGYYPSNTICIAEIYVWDNCEFKLIWPK